MNNDELFDISDEFTKSLEKLVEEETNVAKAYVKDKADNLNLNEESEDVLIESEDLGNTQMFDSEEVKKSAGGVDIGDLLDNEHDDEDAVADDIDDDDMDDDNSDNDINIATSRKISAADLQSKERSVARSKERRQEKIRNFIIIGAVALVVLLAVIGLIMGAIAMSNKNKQSYEYNMEQGNSYYDNGEYNIAVNFYNIAYDTDKGRKDTELMRKLYQCAKAEDDMVLAKEYLDDIIAYDKYNEFAIKELGQYFRKNNDGAAINSMLETYRGTRAESYIKDFEVALPSASETPGTFSSNIKLSLMATAGCTIYYTVDGSEPTTSSNAYSTELLIGTDVVVKAIAVDSIGVKSKVAEFEYKINLKVPDGPVLNIATGATIDTDTVLKVTNLKAGDKVYYTIDGTTPTIESIEYEDGIKLNQGSCIVSLIMVNTSGEVSKITRYTYVVNQIKVYSYEESVAQLKERMIKLNILNADGLHTTSGDKVSFVYESKQEIGGVNMYVIKYVVSSSESTGGYYGVSTKGGICYKVTVTGGKYSAVKY